MVQAPVTRTESERWTAALGRAINACLDVLVEPVSGATFVESATHPGTLYRVTATSCTCAAGTHDVPCMHRAVVLAQSGALALPELAETTPCLSCTAGRIQEWGCGHVIGWKPCDVCDGTGRRPAGAPAVNPARIAA